MPGVSREHQIVTLRFAGPILETGDQDLGVGKGPKLLGGDGGEAGTRLDRYQPVAAPGQRNGRDSGAGADLGDALPGPRPATSANRQYIGSGYSGR
jgi:hypothetical protein